MRKLIYMFIMTAILMGCAAKQEETSNLRVFIDNIGPVTQSYDFGSVKLIDNGPQIRLYLSNAGPETLTGIGIQISGNDAAHFEVTDPTSTVIESGKRISGNIRFQPQSGGVKTATVTVTASVDFTFTVTGTGQTVPDPVTADVYDGIRSDYVYLKWPSESWVTNYLLYCSADDTHSPVLLWDGVQSEYAHNNLSAGSTNYYRVDAYNSNGMTEGEYVMAITASAKNPAPSGETNLQTDNGLLFTYDPAVYSKPTNELVVLTLNMHTYQENAQEDKFELIVPTIAELDADLIAFQECAQHRNGTLLSNGIRTDNMALIIAERLNAYYGLNYYFTWDWAHYGFTDYEEGVAVLSKHPIEESVSRYVSTSSGTSDLTSRKAVAGRVSIPGHEYVHFISAHLHWRTSETDNEQNKQIRNTKAIAAEMSTNYSAPALTFICGDFNGNPTSDFPWSEGYHTMMSNNNYIDTFLQYRPGANTVPSQSQYDTVKGDFPGRIDYVFMSTNDQYSVVASQIIFTPNVLGTVSDHYGVVTRVRKLD